MNDILRTIFFSVNPVSFGIDIYSLNIYISNLYCFYQPVPENPNLFFTCDAVVLDLVHFFAVMFVSSMFILGEKLRRIITHFTRFVSWNYLQSYWN